MRILVTGKYNPDYNRNLVLLSGLRNSEIELIEYPYSERKLNIRRKIKALSEEADLIFLPSFTHLDVPFVRSCTNKKIIFDPLISRYLSKVFDYKSIWRYSPRALKNYLKDKVSFNLSDLIIADTHSHKVYYENKFNIEPSKIFVLPVGVNRGDFFPLQERNTTEEHFVAGFYGSFIPLHGIDKIIETAKILKDHHSIQFRIYGGGSEYRKIFRTLNKYSLNNVFLSGEWVKYSELNSLINKFDLCLGIFGDSLKSDLVIPNKIYHYSACRKPTLTKKTHAIQEIFTQGTNILLSKSDPEDMAEVILTYSNKKEELKNIASEAFNLITEQYNEQMIAQIFIEQAKKLLKRD